MADNIIMIPLSTQCTAFLYAVVTGSVLAICFCFLDALRNVIKLSNFFTAAKDVLCCIVPVILTFLLAMKFCSGKLRWYLFAGELIGYIFLKFTVINTIEKLFYVTLSIVAKAISYMLIIAIKPFIVVLNVLINISLKLKKKVCKIAKKIFIKCKICLKSSSKT